jgi:NitT/TauT family transport system permease protein
LSRQYCFNRRQNLRGKVLRQATVLGSLLGAWQITAAAGLFHKLLFPPLPAIFAHLFLERAEIWQKTRFSLSLIGIGLSAAITAAFVVACLAALLPILHEAVMLLMAVMHPLPGIALLPIFLLWFGIGEASIINTIIFSAFWPLLANIIAGFKTVPAAQLEVGRNLGLRGFPLVCLVMLPSATPHILSGLRVSWARAWQSSVAAELMYGAAGGLGGLGWYLYKKRYMMEIPGVYAAMLVIIAIGILMEQLVFTTIEQKTIRKWRMSSE